jgi:hypothetical protein
MKGFIRSIILFSAFVAFVVYSWEELPEVHKSQSQDGACVKVMHQGKTVPNGCKDVQAGKISRYHAIVVR